MWGNNEVVSTYANLDALYSSHARGASAAWYSTPIVFADAPALNFNLVLPTVATTATTTDLAATAAKLPNLGSFAPQ